MSTMDYPFRSLYFVDHSRSVLWIWPHKNGSTSFRATIGNDGCLERGEAEDLNRAGYFTVACVRHPFDRICSAINSSLRDTTPPMTRVIANWGDPHIVPQRPALEGLRVDFLIRFDCIDSDWRFLQRLLDVPDLEHRNRTADRPEWRDENIEWGVLAPLYSGDLEICADWQRH